MTFNKKSRKISMPEEVTDLGIGNKVLDSDQRIVTKDGKFNIERRGISFFKSFSIYHYLISISWLKFCSLILLVYLLVNIFFALLYLA